MKGKIAVEEHFGMPDTVAAHQNAFKPEYLSAVQRRLPDRDERIEQMDAAGVEVSVLSLTEPGIQGISDAKRAVSEAKRVNDHIAEYFVNRYPKRLVGLGVVALQDPKAAADEYERAVRKLGLKGVMLNGFTNLDEGETVRYLDDPACSEFWAKANELRAPVFLHPRVPLPSQRRSFEGLEALGGSPWGFMRETAEHVIRMILSGLFDRYPNVTLVLGHLGESLLFALPRLDSRLRHQAPGSHGAHLRPATDYLATNFMISTSGIYRTQALQNAILELGADRLIFAVDYPFESMTEIGGWFDSCAISEVDRQKIGRTNAAHLLGLD